MDDLNNIQTIGTQTNPPEDALLEWVSASRPFKKRTKEYYRTLIYLMILVGIILIFIGEILLIMVIAATFFVFYVLSTVPPEQIKHRITKLGIETGSYFHKWEEMREFWFDQQYGENMLVVGMYLGFPSHLRLLLGNQSPEKIKQILQDHIPYREKPEKTFLDKASSWLAQKIPLEKTV